MNVDKPGKSIKGNFLRILGGSGLGQVASFLAIPVTARLYTPMAFGEFSVVLALAAILSPLFLLGMYLAVIAPKEEKEVVGLVGVGVIGSVIGCLLAGLAIWVLFPGGYHSGRLFLSIALPLQILQNCLTSLFNQIAIRGSRYGSLGVRNAAQSVAIIIGQIFCGVVFSEEQFNGLIVGSIFGGIVGNLLLIRFAIPYLRCFKLSMMGPILKKYSRFTFIFGPSTTATLLSTQATLFFVGIWYGAEYAGILGMVERLYVAPIALISFAGQSIFDGELSKIHRSGRHGVKRFYLVSSSYLAIVAVVFGLFLLLLAPYALPVFLGEQWSGTGDTLRIAALVATTRMLTTPIQGIFRIFGRARGIGAITVYRFSALSGALILTVVSEQGYYGAVFLFYLALASSDLLMWYRGFVVAKEENDK